MYSREKIIEVMRRIKKGSEGIQPYVVIAQPRRDLNEMPAQNFDGYENLHIDLLGYSHGYCNIGGEKVDVARNYLFEQALESGAKYLLFVGEDTILPWDGFLKLHETAEKNPDSMIVGVYYIKNSSAMIMIKNGPYITPANVDPGQPIFEVWMSGLDAALIPISMLQKIKDNDPEIPFCCIGNQIEDIPFIGEDNFFVHRLHELGFKILCNPDVQCLHADLFLRKYTCHPSITPEIVKSNYFTNFPLEGRLTMLDKAIIDKRWSDRLPRGTGFQEGDKINESN